MIKITEKKLWLSYSYSINVMLKKDSSTFSLEDLTWQKYIIPWFSISVALLVIYNAQKGEVFD